jgi:thiol:disulfide interchange protein DsbC
LADVLPCIEKVKYMKILNRVVVSLFALIITASVSADDQKIKQTLTRVLPDLPVKSIDKSELAGIYAVNTEAGETLFFSEDGQFFIAGDLYSLKDSKIQNLSEVKREQERAVRVNSISADQKIVFPAQGATKGKIAVFTDIDCGYCRKLHKEVPALNKMGVEVSYLAYPRAGVNSESYNKYVSAFCAEDKLDAMTKAKNGQAIETKVCANHVAEQYNLGREIGISGTPAIILDNGTLIPGYVSADKIAKALGIM